MIQTEKENALKILVEKGKFLKMYDGNDNQGKPKSDYLKKVIEMSDEELSDECENKIWLSAFANNNIRSDFHFQCDACYDECQRRDKSNTYSKAWKTVSND